MFLVLTMSKYSFPDKIRNLKSLIFTKLFYKKARLIRLPFYVRGKKGIQYGKGLTTGHGCRFDALDCRKTLIIGDNARIGDYVHINADKMVSIGDNVLIASKVFISDTSHGAYKGEFQSSPESNPSTREEQHAPVSIGNNVWVGENAIILPGTTIGNGCIIGANTLLNGGNYPDNCIVVGTPGRIIKKYNYITKRWEKNDK